MSGAGYAASPSGSRSATPALLYQHHQGISLACSKLGYTVLSDITDMLEKRLGRLHARLRLGVEADHEAQVFGQGINYFHFENLPLSHTIIRVCLIVAGVYGRGRRNAARVEVKTNDIRSRKIPAAFDEYNPSPQ